MTPYQTFLRYIAIKNHFTRKSYNCIQYNFKVKASRESFEKRNDKLFFYKLSNHSDINSFLVSLFIRNPDLWVGDIVQDFIRAEDIYKQWLKRTQSLSYTFSEDLKKINLKQDLKCTQNQHPRALQLMLREDISPESLMILVDLTGALGRWSKRLEGDIIFERYELILNKYRSFLSYDKKTFKMLLQVAMENQNDT